MNRSTSKGLYHNFNNNGWTPWLAPLDFTVYGFIIKTIEMDYNLYKWILFVLPNERIQLPKDLTKISTVRNGFHNCQLDYK